MHGSPIHALMVALACLAALSLGCDKSIDVEAVSVSDATGKTLTLEDDPFAVYLADDKLQMPVEVAFRATGEAIVTGRSLNLVDFNMKPEDSPACEVTKIGTCSGEVCTLIVRWKEEGLCSFSTSITDDADHGVSTCKSMYVGMSEGAREKQFERFEGDWHAEAQRRCYGESSSR